MNIHLFNSTNYTAILIYMRRYVGHTAGQTSAAHFRQLIEYSGCDQCIDHIRTGIRPHIIYVVKLRVKLRHKGDGYIHTYHKIKYL